MVCVYGLSIYFINGAGKTLGLVSLLPKCLWEITPWAAATFSPSFPLRWLAPLVQGGRCRLAVGVKICQHSSE